MFVHMMLLVEITFITVLFVTMLMSMSFLRLFMLVFLVLFTVLMVMVIVISCADMLLFALCIWLLL